ncbi:hypothetical protein EAI_06285 [Harpegnathos saltator]|uniref:Uncharacterized protein n=1 Tax=Harpegnathos saltator TaxID=610380 RepID=E2BT51_HARSA|nr:hypothetical protein EAI_06285 [Harpegnathos saltator]
MRSLDAETEEHPEMLDLWGPWREGLRRWRFSHPVGGGGARAGCDWREGIEGGRGGVSPYSAKRWGEWKEYLQQQIEGKEQEPREPAEGQAPGEERLQEFQRSVAQLDILLKLQGERGLGERGEALKEKKNKREADFERERKKWRELLEQEREGTEERLQEFQRSVAQLDILLKLQGERGLGERGRRQHRRMGL